MASGLFSLEEPTMQTYSLDLYPAFLDVDYAQWIRLHGLPREWQLGDRAIGRSPAGCRRYKARGAFVPTDKRALGMTGIPACPGLRWQGVIRLCEQKPTTMPVLWIKLG